MDLKNKKCVPCEGGVDPLTPKEIQNYLSVVSGWTLEGKLIKKDYAFNNFAEALDFVNRVGDIAEAEGHHPDIFLHDWKRVEIRLWTHAIGGLHLNDFVVASKIDEMLKRRENEVMESITKRETFFLETS